MAAHHAPCQRIANNARLLVNFLQHEIGVSAFFGSINVPVHMRCCRVYFGAIRVEIRNARRRKLGKLAIFQHHHIARFVQKRNHVACHIRACFALPHNKRAVLARHHNGARFGRTCYCQAIRAIDHFRGAAHRRKQISLIRAFHQMSHHFRIGSTHKMMPIGLQLFTQLRKILNNAIVHHRNRAIARGMRMRIHLAGFAVRCPARMPNAARATQLHALHRLLKRRNFALAPHHVQAVGLINSHARRVVPAILQLLQALNQKRRRRLAAGISHNSAHKNSLC